MKYDYNCIYCGAYFHDSKAAFAHVAAHQAKYREPLEEPVNEEEFAEAGRRTLALLSSF